MPLFNRHETAIVPDMDIPLLLLPGTLCDARAFNPLLERLSPRPFIVETLAGGDSVEAIAERFLADAPARFALMGFSLGGIVALEIATRAPDRVAGLALIDSNARDMPLAIREARADSADKGAEALEAYIGETLWPHYVAKDRLGDEALRQVITDMAVDVGAEALRTQTRVVLSRPDKRPLLRRLTMPALVLAGREDQFCPPEMQEEMADLLPDAQLVLIDNAGHFALMEQPDIIARHVDAWLACLK